MQDRTSQKEAELAREKETFRETVIRGGHRDAEVERLSGETRALTVRLAEAMRTRAEAEAACEEARSSIVPLQLQTTRLESRCAFLTEELARVTASEAQLSREVVEARTARTQAEVGLGSKVGELSAEVGVLRGKLADAEARLARVTASLEAKLGEVKGLQDSLLETAEQARQEMGVQGKLTSLYKKEAEELGARVKELAASEAALQALMEGVRREARAREEQLTADLAIRDKECEKLRADLAQLRGEIVRGQISADAAAAAATDEQASKKRRLVAGASSSTGLAGATSANIAAAIRAAGNAAGAGAGSDGWKNSAETYSVVAELEDKVHTLEAENKKLNTYIRQILQEIELKRPLLNEQREEFHWAVESHAQVSQELARASAERDAARTEARALADARAKLTAERDGLAALRDDLSRQVQTLLRQQAEASRGGALPEAPRHDAGAPAALDAQAVISERLVTFRDIVEIQQRNAELLRVVRALGAEKEAETASRVREVEAQMEKKLASAMLELEGLRQSRARQAQQVADIVRQRDMFRALANSNNSSNKHNSGASGAGVEGEGSSMNTSTTTTTMTTTTAAAADGLVEMGGAGPVPAGSVDLAAVVEDLKRGHEDYVRARLESDASLQGEIAALKETITTLRVDLARASTEATFQKDRNALLAQGGDAAQRDLDGLRSRVSDLAKALVAQEGANDAARREAEQWRDKARSLEYRVSALENEKKLWGESEARLAAERDEAAKQRAQQKVLMASIQAIAEGAETRGAAERWRLAEEVDTLRAQLASKDSAAAAERAAAHAQAERAEADLRDLRAQVEARVSEAAKVREAGVGLKAQLDASIESRAELARRLDALQARVDAGLVPAHHNNQQQQQQQQQPSSEEASLLRFELTAAREELRGAKEALEAARAHAAHFKELAISQERRATELSEAVEQARVATEAAAASRDVRQSEFTAQLDAARAEIASLQAAMAAERARAAQDLAGAAEQHRSALERAAFLEEQHKVIEATDAALREDARRLATLRDAAQQSYDREFIAHAADLQALLHAREALAEAERRASSADERLARAVGESTLAQEAAESRLRAQAAELDRLRELQRDKDSQLQLLHSQLEATTQQLVERAAAAAAGAGPAGGGGPSPFASNADLASDPGARSLHELREVVRFLRKEKEMLEVQVEVAQQEAARMRHQAEAAQRREAEARTALQDEIAKARLRVSSEQAHGETLKALGEANLLRESNQLLRGQVEDLTRKLQAQDARVSSLEAQLAPAEATRRQLASERDTLAAELQAARLDLTHQRAKVQQAHDKLQHVDPDQFKALVEKEAAARAELAKVAAEKVEADARAEKLKSQGLNWKNAHTKLKAEFAELQAKVSAGAGGPGAGAAASEQQIGALKAELEQVKAELERVSSEKAAELAALQKRVDNSKLIYDRKAAEIQGLKAENQSLKNEIEALKRKTEDQDQEMGGGGGGGGGGEEEVVAAAPAAPVPAPAPALSFGFNAFGAAPAAASAPSPKAVAPPNIFAAQKPPTFTFGVSAPAAEPAAASAPPPAFSWGSALKAAPTPKFPAAPETPRFGAPAEEFQDDGQENDEDEVMGDEEVVEIEDDEDDEGMVDQQQQQQDDEDNGGAEEEQPAISSAPTLTFGSTAVPPAGLSFSFGGKTSFTLPVPASTASTTSPLPAGLFSFGAPPASLTSPGSGSAAAAQPAASPVAASPKFFFGAPAAAAAGAAAAAQASSGSDSEAVTAGQQQQQQQQQSSQQPFKRKIARPGSGLVTAPAAAAAPAAPSAPAAANPAVPKPITFGTNPAGKGKGKGKGKGRGV